MNCCSDVYGCQIRLSNGRFRPLYFGPSITKVELTPTPRELWFGFIDHCHPGVRCLLLSIMVYHFLLQHFRYTNHDFYLSGDHHHPSSLGFRPNSYNQSIRNSVVRASLIISRANILLLHAADRSLEKRGNSRKSSGWPI